MAAKHERKPKKTGAKAERPEDQEIVDRYFGTDTASTIKEAEDSKDD